MTTLHAQPYNIEATGFYFSSAEEYTTKQEALRDRFGAPVEEFELQFIDGDDGQLFEACGINQCNLPTWFDDIETLEDYEKAALFYLVNQVGYRLDQALEKLADVCISECSLIDAATELFDEVYLSEVPESVRFYIDYEAFAYACRVNGDMTEFNFNGVIYTCTNANGI